MTAAEIVAEYQKSMEERIALLARRTQEYVTNYAGKKPHRAIELTGLAEDVVKAVAAYNAVKDAAAYIKP